MKVLLYSGGMDSWLIDKLWEPDVRLYIDIHGRYSEAEKARLPEGTTIVDMPFLGQQEQDDGFVPLRNLYFLMIASHFGDELCLGVTDGDGSKDKCPQFLIDTEATLQHLWKDKKVFKDVRVEKRFAYMSKGELVEAYLAKGGDVQEIKDQAFSCYSPQDGHECFFCYPCFRKFAVLKAHGAEFSEAQEKAVWEYVKDAIIPTKEEGGYGGTYYTERGKESADLEKTVRYLREKYE